MRARQVQGRGSEGLGDDSCFTGEVEPSAASQNRSH